MSNTETIYIDGSMGEGGGQILRTSLALSCITGKRLHIENIRSVRPKPGLAKQHLCCVQAACQICNGESKGAEQGSKELDFCPGAICSGEYSFDIGSAGSASLVLQTVLPPLFSAEESSTVTVAGGTHNPLAPPFDFLSDTFLPAIASTGFQCDCRLLKHGFFPAGGGKMIFDIHCRQRTASGNHPTMNICQAIQEYQMDVRIYTARLPVHIAQRQERLLLQSGLNIKVIKHLDVTDSDGPGNAVCIRLGRYDRTTVFTAFGMRGKRSEKVISELVRQVKDFVKSGAAIDRFLADQLLIYMAIAKGGRYTTEKMTTHTETNMEVIRKFLPVEFITEQRGKHLQITCQPVQ